MMRPRTWFGFAACSVLFAAALPAHANGRYPQANALEVSPFDGSDFVLRTTFGFMFSHDQGKTWKWVCETAAANISVSAKEDPALGILNNRIILGAEEGLSSTVDKGCTWKVSDKTPIFDVVTRPNVTSSALLLQSASVASDSGALSYTSKVLETTDNGATYKALAGVIDPSLIVETIDVAASDGARIYVSGRGYDASGTSHAYVLTSRDSGATYTKYEVPLVKGEESVFVAAVDPRNANRVYVRTGTTLDHAPQPGTSPRGWYPPAPARLLISDDGGATYKVAYQGQNVLLGFALSADGATVYVGGPDDGVQVAPVPASVTGPLAFKQTSKIHVICLRRTSDTLYACSDESSGFFLGASKDDGKSWNPLLHLQCTVGPDTLLDCPATSSMAICSAPDPSIGGQSPLAFLGDTNRTGATDEDLAACSGAAVAPDAGAGGDAASEVDAGGGSVTSPDAGTSGTNGASSDSGGCSVTAAPFSLSLAAGNVLAVGAVAALLRRRRR